MLLVLVWLLVMKINAELVNLVKYQHSSKTESFKKTKLKKLFIEGSEAFGSTRNPLELFQWRPLHTELNLLLFHCAKG